jgi:hypothetical protein
MASELEADPSEESEKPELSEKNGQFPTLEVHIIDKSRISNLNSTKRTFGCRSLFMSCETKEIAVETCLSSGRKVIARGVSAGAHNAGVP